VFLQQLRIALTARFDEDTVKLKSARSREEVTADKSVITYKRIGKLKTALLGVYNVKRKYGDIPEPQPGKISSEGRRRHLRELRQCSPLFYSTSRSYPSSRTRTRI
jgi:hypothetical protein